MQEEDFNNKLEEVIRSLREEYDGKILVIQEENRKRELELQDLSMELKKQKKEIKQLKTKLKKKKKRKVTKKSVKKKNNKNSESPYRVKKSKSFSAVRLSPMRKKSKQKSFSGMTHQELEKEYNKLIGKKVKREKVIKRNKRLDKELKDFNRKYPPPTSPSPEKKTEPRRKRKDIERSIRKMVQEKFNEDKDMRKFKF